MTPIHQLVNVNDNIYVFVILSFSPDNFEITLVGGMVNDISSHFKVQELGRKKSLKCLLNEDRISKF